MGGEKLFKFDVRIMAATRRDLDREVQMGRFRDDLNFRLVVARIELPALRQRISRNSTGGRPMGPSWQRYPRGFRQPY